jgi:asparagine synthase (glutamine-hydrolysing)
LEVGGADGLKTVRYWDPLKVALVPGRSPQWYADTFREHFVQAVQARLRSTSSKLGVQVSGGFDSTAVAAVVHDCNRRLNLGLEVHAFLNIGRHPLADEQRYMQAVLERYPMSVVVTAAEEYWAWKPAPLLSQWQDEPYEGPYMARLCADLEAARALGVGVILTGNGGDEIGGNSLYLFDLLWRGRVGRWWPELKARSAGKRQSPSALLRTMFWAIARWGRRLVGREPRRPPSWIELAFAKRLRLRQYYRHPTLYWNPTRDDIHDRLSAWWTEPLLSLGQEVYTHYGVGLRHPFLDRRLFEWALMIPPFRLGEQGLVKAPLRRALADLLPAAILKRGDKGNYLSYLDLGLRVRERERILKMIERPLAAELGYVDARRLRWAYEAYCQGGDIDRTQLWNTLTFEAWLRYPHVQRWLGVSTEE